MKAVTLAVPCRADEPELGRTLAIALASWHAAALAVPLEVLVCLNGRDAERSPAFAAMKDFAARHGCALAHVRDDGDVRPSAVEKTVSTEETRRYGEASGSEQETGALHDPTDRPSLDAPLTVVAITTSREGKPIAWNLLRRHARGDTALFLDADVDLSPDAFGLLLTELAASPAAAVVSPKTTCAPRPGEFERIMAVPYRIDFPNLSGQLYAARVAALPETMPDDLIEPERWLELVLGRERVGRERRAHVVVRLPATLRDFFTQRIRIEMGKVQLDADYPELQARGTSQPRLRATLAALGPLDLARLALYLALRETAHAIARRRWKLGRRAGVWRSVGSTKRWTAAGAR